MVLTAQHLGAGETLIGALLALSPFLVLLQIPGSNSAKRVGPKRLVIAGWTLRSYTLLGMAGMPLLQGHVSSALLLAGLALCLFIFNFVRGYTSCGMYPLLTATIPTENRGRYLGLEQISLSLGIMTALLSSGLWLGHAPESWRFSLLFVVGWAAGQISVGFLRALPDTEPEDAPQITHWRGFTTVFADAWRHLPFRRLTRLMAWLALVTFALPGFIILFLRTGLGLPENVVLYLYTATTTGSMLGGLFISRMVDRTGSRPLMRLSLGLLTCVTVTWMLLALQVVHPPVPMIGLLCLTMGIGLTSLGISQTRLFLSSGPPRETTLALAYNQVIVSICAGTAAIAWGGMLERVDAIQIGSRSISGFVLLFGGTTLLLLLAQGLLSRIKEPTAYPTLRLLNSLFLDWPLRIVPVHWLTRLRRK